MAFAGNQPNRKNIDFTPQGSAPGDAVAGSTIYHNTSGLIFYTGTEWVATSGTGGGSELNELTDVTISSVASGQVLQYDGSNFVNVDTVDGSGAYVWHLHSSGVESSDVATSSSPWEVTGLSDYEKVVLVFSEADGSAPVLEMELGSTSSYISSDAEYVQRVTTNAGDTDTTASWLSSASHFPVGDTGVVTPGSTTTGMADSCWFTIELDRVNKAESTIVKIDGAGESTSTLGKHSVVGTLADTAIIDKLKLASTNTNGIQFKYAIYGLKTMTSTVLYDIPTTLDSLSNVSAPSPSTEDSLVYNGSSWVPSGITGGDGKVLVSSDDTTSRYLEDAIVDGSGTTTRTLTPGGDETLEIDLIPEILAKESTGLIEGAALSVGGTTGTFSVSAGKAFHMDNANFPPTGSLAFTIAAKTNVSVTNIATHPVTYVLIDKDDSVVQSTTYPTAEERRDNVFLGVVIHSDNTNVELVNNIPTIGFDIGAQVEDLMNGLGHFNLSGNVISASGTGSLAIDKSAGKAFKRGANYENNRQDPHTVTLAAIDPITFRYRNQDSSEGSDTNLIDPTTYDNAGTTTSVPQSHNATIQRIYLFPSNTVRVQRGQTVYSNLSDAVDAIGKETFTTETNIDENALLLASIALTKDCTDLTDASDARIFQATRFGELGSVASSAVVPALGDLTDVSTAGASSNEALVYNGSSWVPAAMDLNTNVAGDLMQLDDCSAAGLADASGIAYNQGTKTWEVKNFNLGHHTTGELNDLSNVSTSPSIADSLVWNGSSWAASGVTGGGGSSTLNGLTDVTAPSPASGDMLKYNGSNWESYTTDSVYVDRIIQSVDGQTATADIETLDIANYSSQNVNRVEWYIFDIDVTADLSLELIAQTYVSDVVTDNTGASDYCWHLDGGAGAGEFGQGDNADDSIFLSFNDGSTRYDTNVDGRGSARIVWVNPAEHMANPATVPAHFEFSTSLIRPDGSFQSHYGHAFYYGATGTSDMCTALKVKTSTSTFTCSHNVMVKIEKRL